MQINHGRIAAKTLKYQQVAEIIVFDMKSGDIILNCNQDLKLHVRQSFLMRKKSFLLADLGRIISAVFWI